MSIHGRTTAASGPVTGATARQAPGVVKLRLSGTAADLAVLAGLLTALPRVEVIDRSGAYANRREPGERVYLTVRIAAAGG